MTGEQLHAEAMFQAGVAPFLTMEKSGIISPEDLRTVVTILARKYRPVFVHYIGSD